MSLQLLQYSVSKKYQKVVKSSWFLVLLLMTHCLSFQSVIACTPVRGTNPIGDSQRIISYYGLASIIIFFITVSVFIARGKKGLFFICTSLLLCLLHRVWYSGVWVGDCGKGAVEMAKSTTIILLALLVIQVLLWRLKTSNIKRINT